MKPRHFLYANLRENFPLSEIAEGGWVGALGGAGRSGILQAEGVAGCGKSMSSLAAPRPAKETSSAAITRQGSSVLDSSVPVVRESASHRRGTRAEPDHTNPLSTSPAFQSDHLEFKGYEYRPNFEPPQQDYPAASVAHFLTAAYNPPHRGPDRMGTNQ